MAIAWARLAGRSGNELGYLADRMVKEAAEQIDEVLLQVHSCRALTNLLPRGFHDFGSLLTARRGWEFDADKWIQIASREAYFSLFALAFPWT